MNLFLVRLMPPRADFAQTLTDDEQHTMDLHGTYWEQLRNGGHVVVYGPVADPEGVWGLGVVYAFVFRPLPQTSHADEGGG